MLIAQQLINREKNGEFPSQKSDEWYRIRHNMLTASEIASALNCNIYQTSYELLLKKLAPVVHISNDATEWGIIFESIAVEYYEFITKETVYKLGLITHPAYSWIGASPDGLLLNGKLLEIKCPIRRCIGGDMPLSYWIQIQIQLEVCDLEECDYFECKFYQYPTKEEYESDIDNTDVKNILIHGGRTIYYKLINSHLKTINRDKAWFKNNIEILQSFYDILLYYRGVKNGTESLKINMNNKRKRPDAVYQPLKQVCLNNVIRWDNWVSATRIRNYMIDDPIIDWLSMYSSKTNTPKSSPLNMSFQQYVMKQGIKFEENIINTIKQKFPNCVATVANYQEAKSYNKYIETVKHIKNGTPIIYQGVFHDYECKTFGMPDLLVRCDYLNKLFDTPISTKNSKNTYRIVEIKFILLELCADGEHLRNSNKNVIAYKGQLYIYNKILGKIQGTTPSKSYILGKKWTYKKCNEVFSGDSFERAAHVNFKYNESFIRSKTANAIKWIRDLTKKGNKWDVYSRDELKPNMCYIDDQWQGIKKKIADVNNDITLLWQCGIKNRKIAENNGVKNWKTHKNLTSAELGVFGVKTSSTLQLIINMNQCSSISGNQDSLITPKKITSTVYDWNRQNDIVEFFIDFETITGIITTNKDCPGSFIFMIGVGINLDGAWAFKCFTADSLTLISEKIMMSNFHKYIESFKGSKKLWHWGAAEQHLYTNCMNRHIDILSNYNLLTEWCDLLRLFKGEPIVARGMLNFSLKTVVKAFYDNCFIETSYNELDVNNGLYAMVQAYELYSTGKYSNVVETKIMKSIIKYNEIDCKVLLEILQYLRKNHV